MDNQHMKNIADSNESVIQRPHRKSIKDSAKNFFFGLFSDPNKEMSPPSKGNGTSYNLLPNGVVNSILGRSQASINNKIAPSRISSEGVRTKSNSFNEAEAQEGTDDDSHEDIVEDLHRTRRLCMTPKVEEKQGRRETVYLAPTIATPEDLRLFKEDAEHNETIIESKECVLTLPTQPDNILINGILFLTALKVIIFSGSDSYVIEYLCSIYRDVSFKPFNSRIYEKGMIRKSYLTVSLGAIIKVEKSTDKKASNIVNLYIYSQDGRMLNLRIAEKVPNEATQLFRNIEKVAFTKTQEQAFAFDYALASFNKWIENKFQGWNLYDIEKEFLRQKVRINSNPKLTEDYEQISSFRLIDNKNFQVCSTYPPLLLVPEGISDQQILDSCKFRLKERLPVVTYHYARTGATISRSSQIKTGLLKNRSKSDELLLKLLGGPDSFKQSDTSSTKVSNTIDTATLQIYTTRPFMNSVETNVKTRRFENTEWYKNCDVTLMNIEDPYHVKEVHKKLIELCSSQDDYGTKWYSQLEATNWLKYISDIIKTAIKVSNFIRKGKSCLIHCINGSDRTPQVVSLTQIMLDPYYRTIEGFQVLVNKDWIYFGHQFYSRTKNTRDEKDNKRAPIFIQFLDCVYQLMHQYPYAFEFNIKFLMDVAFHASSYQFGTFLMDSYQDITLLRLKERTISLWSYMNSKKEAYINPFFFSFGDNEWLVLKPNVHMKCLVLWEEYFLQFGWFPKTKYDEELGLVNEDETTFFELKYMVEKNEVKKLKQELEALNKQLEEKRKGNEQKKDEVKEGPDSLDFTDDLNDNQGEQREREMEKEEDGEEQGQGEEEGEK